MDEQLDYKKMFENALMAASRKMQLETTYFDLLTKILDLKDIADLVISKMWELSMEDQIPLLKLTLASNEYCKQMAEKYGFEVEGGDT